MPKKCLMQTIESPVNGQIRSLDDVQDPAFSSRSMGDGFAIFSPSGHIYSPIDGEIMWVLPAKHALGLKDMHGFEYLLHVGIDTVFLQGEGFESRLFLNQRIEKGDLLIELDHLFLRKEKQDLTTMLVLTSHPQSRFAINKEYEWVRQGESNLLRCKGKGCL